MTEITSSDVRQWRRSLEFKKIYNFLYKKVEAVILSRSCVRISVGRNASLTLIPLLPYGATAKVRYSFERFSKIKRGGFLSNSMYKPYADALSQYVLSLCTCCDIDSLSFSSFKVEKVIFPDSEPIWVQGSYQTFCGAERVRV